MAQGESRGDGNDRERGTEKLTSHRSAEIIHRDKQRRDQGTGGNVGERLALRNADRENNRAVSETNYGLARSSCFPFYFLVAK